MARIDIEIEDYLDEVSTYSLILELENRKLNKEHVDKLRIITQGGGLLEKLDELKHLSLADSIKIEEFLETFKK
jgi:hypothetical protein